MGPALPRPGTHHVRSWTHDTHSHFGQAQTDGRACIPGQVGAQAFERDLGDDGTHLSELQVVVVLHAVSYVGRPDHEEADELGKEACHLRVDSSLFREGWAPHATPTVSNAFAGCGNQCHAARGCLGSVVSPEACDLCAGGHGDSGSLMPRPLHAGMTMQARY